ncbi:unnamed protein product, partial [Ascophyllum nodosum]
RGGEIKPGASVCHEQLQAVQREHHRVGKAPYFRSSRERKKPFLCITFFFFFNLTYSRWTSSLPSCLWSERIFPSVPGSRLTLFFLSRCKFSTLTTRQPMVE